jgi:outer membrane cobalamin receptor
MRKGNGNAMSLVTATICLLWADATKAQAPDEAEPEVKFAHMGEIVVVATRAERDRTKVPSAVRIMDAEVVRLAQAMTLDELFRSLAGVDLQSSGFPGGKPRVSMRGLTPGFGSKRVLVLVDGRRINDAFQGSADFMLLPTDAIERIEVAQGPASALYGSNAMGGVINIVTRRGDATPVTALRMAAGSHRTRHFQAAHGARAGALDYFAAGSHIETDGFTRNRDGSKRDWRAEHALVNLGTAPDAHSDLRIGLGSYHGRGRDDEAARDSRTDYQTVAYSRNWNGAPDALFSARLYRNGERHLYDWSYPGRGLYDLETWAADLQQAFRVGDRQRWVIGGELRREQADIDETTGPIDETTDTGALYLQDEIQISDRWIATLGLRLDANADYTDAWSPRMGLLWLVSADSEIFAGIHRAHRAPALSDRFVNVQFAGMRFEGNPDLDPETLTAYELGWRGRWLERRLQAETTLFYNNLEDSFDFALAADGVFRNRNASRAQTQGADLRLRYAPGTRLAITLNYAYTDGEYRRFESNPTVEGNRLPYLARHKATLEVETVCPLGWSHLARLRHVDTRFGDDRNTAENKLDAYATVDWRTRAPIGGHAAATLSVDNVFDETYRDLPNEERPGRVVMAGLETMF